LKHLEAKINRVIVAKIEPDEDLIDSILKLVIFYDINSGFLNCIGAFKKFTLGYFDLNKKAYKYKTFTENVELISCIGNIAYKDGEPIIHAHITVGTSDYNVIGGHLSQPSIISVTSEVCIYEIDQKINRSTDQRFNLALLDL
jgi:predicted DNA-binding protein with PD1-like motif